MKTTVTSFDAQILFIVTETLSQKHLYDGFIFWKRERWSRRHLNGRVYKSTPDRPPRLDVIRFFAAITTIIVQPACLFLLGNKRKFFQTLTFYLACWTLTQRLSVEEQMLKVSWGCCDDPPTMQQLAYAAPKVSDIKQLFTRCQCSSGSGKSYILLGGKKYTVPPVLADLLMSTDSFCLTHTFTRKSILGKDCGQW